MGIKEISSVVAVALLFTGLSDASPGAEPNFKISSASGEPCDLVARPSGSDSSPGTSSQPLRTAQVLVDRLSSGQTGCLGSGTFSQDLQVKVTVPDIDLTSVAGEAPILKTRLWVASDRVVVSWLNLDGRNPNSIPSPTVTGDEVVFRANDVTNHHTSICFTIGSKGFGHADNVAIARNNIHDCGRLPATNFDHGIYVEHASGTSITENLIVDNADRGVQLYPDSDNSIVEGNIIAQNGEGLIFGGDDSQDDGAPQGPETSSGNLVRRNLITHSKLRDNVESSWADTVGTGNEVRKNCVFGGPYDEGDGGILSPSRGFTPSNNRLVNPRYRNRAGGDYRLKAGSPCADLLDRPPGIPRG